MDDDAVGRRQAHLVREAIEAAGIEVGQLWMHYFSVGGEAGEMEIDAFLHHSLTLPVLQWDLLAHATNELLDQQRPTRIPQASDLLDHDDPDDAGQDQHGTRDQDTTEEP
ncbi:hypothetical protein [Kocuria aegyptia]|uniref:Uncharacterized protein n=1 Tax=Kocuria aegyptia TaxID=330943 RepID=A0ABP4WFH7_9MICC